MSNDRSPLRVGSKIKFIGEVQRYTVQASNERYAVCTKPMNALKTTIYTIIDFERAVRGLENLIFGMGFETQKECEEALERLVDGESEVSHRHYVRLEIERIDPPK
jgi:hypothetical protein